ncbi:MULTISPECIES: hypothetical protein [Streptomyces]|uniref:Alpha/beta hydrolase n=1 Tax=Streptomyces dengpaensis TaxID=2049881 RepID=A0ABM6SU61_9ACTN|nr:MULTISPECIES: hypothetical protein [Streptomyces]AVH58245.1 hypothetical protein C4B68_23540 [Streptomyces dengpaensis]PIB08069.1 hypothetical protein B1C81_16805 [Streptomyces sp. HG99]
MSALLFIHGTGVRQPAYGETLTLLRDRLGAIVPGTPVHDCYWGDAFGVPPNVGTAVLPGAPVPAPEPEPEPEPVVVEELAEDDRDAVTWGVLYEDPLVPLRRQKGDDGGLDDAGGLMLGDRSGKRVEDRARALAAGPPAPLERLLDIAGAREEFAVALTTVLDSPEGSDALTHGLGPGQLPQAVATAAVAQLAGSAQRRGAPLLWTKDERDEAVRIITGELGGQTRGVGFFLVLGHGYVAHKLGVMRALEKRRAWLMTRSHPNAGDILKYLARGHGLRTLIKDRVTEVARTHGPVVLLAHSLGGIAAVDLLAQEELPGVRHLVTVGSQAAHLHEIGALPGLVPGSPLPGHFPAWTNVYDRRDLLGFTAEPVFPGRVTDIELSSGQPFPAAHSGYFPNPEVHRLLAGILQSGA